MKDRRRTAFWLLLISGLLTFALAMGYRWFERGGAFNLDTVTIRGIRPADSSVVCESVKSLFGTSIWQIELSEVQAELSEIPGIDSVNVRRAPLSGLILEIGISEPVYAVRDSAGISAVSSFGEVLPERFLSDSLPVIESRKRIGSALSLKLAEWFSSAELQIDDFQCRFTENGLTVCVNSEYEVLLGIDLLTDRWNSYLQLSSSLNTADEWFQVDMRYQNQAILRSSIENAASQEEI